MNVVLSWLGQQAILVYAICLLGALVYVFNAVAIKRKGAAAQFTLERQIYQQQMTRARLMVLLFGVLAGVVFMARQFLLPTVPKPLSATPTLSVGLFTPTPPLADLTLAATEVLTPVVVSAPPASLTETPTPTALPVSQEETQPDCPSPNAQITDPVVGSNLTGIVEIFGTATVNAFSYYKFEVRFPGSDTPNFIAQYTAAKKNDSLGTWDVSDPARYPPGGPYRFQIVVVDIYGNTTTCTIPVNIVGEQE